MCFQNFKNRFLHVAFMISLGSFISCKGHTGANGQDGINAALLGALTATCMSGSPSTATISNPSFVPSVLAANNIKSLFCSMALNNITPWADYDVWSCNTETNSLVYEYSPLASEGITFSWPVDGNTMSGVPNITTYGSTASGEAFYCATACNAEYTDGTSAYILLVGSGTCQ